METEIRKHPEPEKPLETARPKVPYLLGQKEKHKDRQGEELQSKSVILDLNGK